jgi:uncharacterized tellurite resistance protein B-like protein
VFPDSIQLLSENGRKRHANLLIIIAGADGELVREEIAAIESAMGLMMIHPNVRTELRSQFADPINLDLLLKEMDAAELRLALKNGAIVAAVDGEYDNNEILLLKKIAATAGVSDARLKQLLNWVRNMWKLEAKGRQIVGSPMQGDDSQ